MADIPQAGTYIQEHYNSDPGLDLELRLLFSTCSSGFSSLMSKIFYNKTFFKFPFIQLKFSYSINKGHNSYTVKLMSCRVMKVWLATYCKAKLLCIQLKYMRFFLFLNF